jgi:hypothetical protein
MPQQNRLIGGEIEAILLVLNGKKEIWQKEMEFEGCKHNKKYLFSFIHTLVLTSQTKNRQSSSNINAILVHSKNGCLDGMWALSRLQTQKSL